MTAINPGDVFERRREFEEFRREIRRNLSEVAEGQKVFIEYLWNTELPDCECPLCSKFRAVTTGGER